MLPNLEKKRLHKELAAIRAYVDSLDTPSEMRKTTQYQFILGVKERLIELGMPNHLAAKSAVNIKCELPNTFHIDYPEEFFELVRMFAKMTFVLWKVALVDFDDDIYEDIFLELAKRVELNWHTS